MFIIQLFSYIFFAHCFMFDNLSVSSIEAFSSEEKAELHDENGEVYYENNSVAAENVSDTSETSSLAVGEELDEDNPPLKAVLGFLPNDYTAGDFYAGVHLHYATRKQGPWQEGTIVKSEQDGSTVTMTIR